MELDSFWVMMSPLVAGFVGAVAVVAFAALGKWVKSTKNTVDDEIYNAVKLALQDEKKNSDKEE